MTESKQEFSITFGSGTKGVLRAVALLAGIGLSAASGKFAMDRVTPQPVTIDQATLTSAIDSVEGRAAEQLHGLALRINETNSLLQQTINSLSEHAKSEGHGVVVERLNSIQALANAERAARIENDEREKEARIASDIVLTNAVKDIALSMNSVRDAIIEDRRRD